MNHDYQTFVLTHKSVTLESPPSHKKSHMGLASRTSTTIFSQAMGVTKKTVTSMLMYVGVYHKR